MKGYSATCATDPLDPATTISGLIDSRKALPWRMPGARPNRWAAVACLSATLVLGGCGSDPVRQSDGAELARPQRYLLVGGTASMAVGVLQVGLDGALSPITGSPFDTGMGFSLVVTPDGRKVYVASLWRKEISGHHIGADGVLTPIDDARIELDSAVVGLALTPDGKRLVATSGLFSTEVQVFDIDAGGGLSATAPALPLGEKSALTLPAITPDGRFLYLVSAFSDRLRAYALGDDGGLTAIAEPLVTRKRPVLPTITPDGRFLYLSDENDKSLSGYAIGDDGGLTPIPAGHQPTGKLPHGAAYSADSRRLYVPEAMGGIAGFAIADDGALSPLPGSPWPGPAGTLPGRIVINPDDSSLVVIDVLTRKWHSRVHPYRINADGSLTASGPAVNSGVLFADGPSTVMTPNQGPMAVLALVDNRGRTLTFSAAESVDQDGTIARYQWDFGDGHIVATTTPRITHTFDSSGEHSVSVTVSDDEGCASERVFSGQMTTCNGGPQARASLQIQVGG